MLRQKSPTNRQKTQKTNRHLNEHKNNNKPKRKKIIQRSRSRNMSTSSLTAQQRYDLVKQENPNYDLITLAFGCYWGSNKYQVHFKDALVRTTVGFMGGAIENPSYKQVCSGTTNHVEVADFVFDTTKVDLFSLLQYFYALHDPTTFNRQGGDIGTQYASAIFVYNDEQRIKAELVTQAFQNALASNQIKMKRKSGAGYEEREVKTVIRDASAFYPAHEEHQDYLFKNPDGYCNHWERFVWDAENQPQLPQLDDFKAQWEEQKKQQI